MLSNDEGKMRTALCGELRAEDEGKEVVLVGWTANKRNLGGLLFIDLRDRSGLCQVRVDDAAHCPDIRNEYLLQVRGKVVRKPVANKKLASGEIEVAASSIEVVSKSEQPPFIVADETDALEDTLELLSAVPVQAGAVLHCYSGSAEMLERFAKLGLYFGFDGPVTFKNAVKPKEALAACPLDRLLLETDAPYMAPTPMRGKRNEPAFVRYVAEEAARIKNLPLREVEEKTTSNAFDLFHVKHD